MSLARKLLPLCVLSALNIPVLAAEPCTFPETARAAPAWVCDEAIWNGKNYSIGSGEHQLGAILDALQSIALESESRVSASERKPDENEIKLLPGKAFKVHEVLMTSEYSNGGVKVETQFRTDNFNDVATGQTLLTRSRSIGQLSFSGNGCEYSVRLLQETLANKLVQSNLVEKGGECALGNVMTALSPAIKFKDHAYDPLSGRYYVMLELQPGVKK